MVKKRLTDAQYASRAIYTNMRRREKEKENIEREIKTDGSGSESVTNI
jgi:hypothetical protein